MSEVQACKKRLIELFRYDTRHKGEAKKELDRFRKLGNVTVLSVKDNDFPSRSWTLFHHAVRNGWLDILDQLLTMTQFEIDDPSEILDYGRYNLLHTAIINDQPEIAAYLKAAYKMNSFYCFPLFPQIEAVDLAILPQYRNVKEYLEEVEAQGYSNDVQYLKEKAQKQQALLEAMSENVSGNFHLNNIIMHGPAEAGKSCVQKLILGEPPPPNRRTPIIENAVRAVRFIRAGQTENQIKVIEEDELLDIIATTVMVHYQKRTGNEQSTTPEPFEVKESKAKQSSQATLEEMEVEESPKRHSSMTNIDTSNSPVMNDIKAKSKMLNNMTQKVIFSLEWYHIFDSGGQPQFLDLLPLIFQSVSVTVIVIRLTDDLYEKKRVFVNGTDDGEGKNLPKHLLLSNYEFIQRTCQIASARGSKVMIVGTHRDQLANCEADKCKIVDDFNQKLNDIGETFVDTLISKSVEEIIFDLNAISEGEERKKNTKLLQQCINSACVHTKAPSLTSEIPLKWIIFHLKLLKENNVNVVDIKRCNELAHSLGMDEADTHTALRYLHNAGLLLHISKDIPVLTKFDPLIDKLSWLVLASGHLPNPTSRADCKRLCNYGLFSLNFLEDVFNNNQQALKCHDLDNHTFLKMIVHLMIAIPIGNDYFLPSALSASLQPSSNATIDMKCIPLAFSWDKKFLPHGFFFTVVINLMHKSNTGSRPYSFVLLVAGSSQHRREIRIREANNTIPGVVQLTNRDTWIQVSTSSSRMYCPTIHDLVNNAIQKTITLFKEDQNTIVDSPKITYLCPSCENRDHYCILTPEGKEYSCSEDHSITECVREDMLCWLPQCEEQSFFTIEQSFFTTVVDEIQQVVKWKILGLALNVRKCELDMIGRDHHDICNCRKAMVQLWVRIDRRASWMKLCHALSRESVGENNLANHLANKYSMLIQQPDSIIVGTALATIFLLWAMLHSVGIHALNKSSKFDCKLLEEGTDDDQLANKRRKLEKQSLDDQDLFEILEEVVTVNEWEDFGLALGIKPYKLEEIKTNFGRDVAECRMEMLSHWLNNHNASWEKLCLALEQDIVGSHKLAQRIRRKKNV